MRIKVKHEGCRRLGFKLSGKHVDVSFGEDGEAEVPKRVGEHLVKAFPGVVVSVPAKKGRAKKGGAD